jgi:hypothetical protein
LYHTFLVDVSKLTTLVSGKRAISTLKVLCYIMAEINAKVTEGK